MADYDFSTLSSSDLEDLVCDLLNAELPDNSEVRYKTFKDGKDKGIDLLYSTDTNEYEEVGQVKHYYRTGYDGLYSHLKKSEVDKAKKLAPSKYILATSVDLSVNQTQELRDLFKPYLKDLNDVYGKKDLNTLIETHEQVLHAHYKLWFSDTTVLEKILNSNLIYRSADFVESELTKRLRLYVKTPLLDTALQSLTEHNFIIITGEPGVGKTTLAEMLSYEYIKDGYEFLFINDDIKDADRFIRHDDSKQIVYYDDFLGSNGEEMNRAQGRETTLLNIIGRVRRAKNKKLVFTTRVHILNTAAEQSEKLTRARIRSGETVFNLDEYDNDIKKALLISHIDEAEIDEELKTVLRDEKIMDFIVNHKGFTPRSVELIMWPENIAHLTPDSYHRYILENFGDPEEIWGHAYKQQIGDAERLLLNTLLTFDESVELKNLEAAFYHRIAHDERAQQRLGINPFKTAMARLNKGFIMVKHGRVGFINTSLKDFLLKYVKSDPIEVRLMLGSLRFVQQLGLLLNMAKPFGYHVPSDIQYDMMVNYLDYIRSTHRDQDIIRLAILAQQQVKDRKKEQHLIDMINDIYDWHSLYKDYSLNQDFSRFLATIKDNYQLQDVLKERVKEIVDELVSNEDDLSRAVDLLEQLAETFDLDFEDYDKKEIIRHLDQLFSDHIFEESEWLRDYITDEGEANDKIKEVRELENRLGAIGLEYSPDMTELDQDWDEIARENEFRRLMEKDD